MSKKPSKNRRKRLEYQAIKRETKPSRQGSAENSRLPKPVLPPQGELVKFIGKVKNFKIEEAREYFEPQDYQIVEQQQANEREASRFRWMLLLVSTTNPQNAALTLSASRRTASFGYFVRMALDETEGFFEGWLWGELTLEKGEEVELIAVQHEKHYELYGIHKPKERILNVLPEASMSIKATKQSIIRFHFELLGYTAVFGIIISLFLEGLTADNLLGILFLMTLVGIGNFLSSRVEYYGRKRTSSKVAEDIFKVLGFENYDTLDLEKTTRQRIKELKQKKEFINDPKKYPTRGSFSSLYKFFYY